jgi:pyruvate/2-oxoglutarate/acetoin dehydrogenase E1 component/pyruvate/2-oxoglutarate dehydrogenase complex dihydrolipoamide acyltransferase (E2) component
MYRVTAAAVAPRVAEHLNQALRELFERDELVYLLGEDVVDPYGGAFKITKGLSTRYPDRVIATPLSEGGLLGVGGGLALCGNRVIVEVMFGDFLALGFDQVLNFATKSVSMYGTTVPVRLLVRCPVGGNRGYGPTHSQSLQKHFIGVPNLALYELSPFHDATALLDAAFGRGVPGILFEDKVLYTRRMCRGDRVDDLFRWRILGPPGPGWAHAYADGEADRADVVVIAPGGVAHRALDAARRLGEQTGERVHVLTPGQLYPLDIEPVLPLLAAAGRIAVAEESTAGGTWGAEVARVVYERIWAALRGPVMLFNSADSIIPTAAHLEREVVLGADDIVAGLQTAGATGAATAPAAEPQEPDGDQDGVPVTAPKLNNNDTAYLVVDWLVDEGEWVEAGADVVSLETSKAVEDIPAPAAGRLHRVARTGTEVSVGTVLGYLLPDGTAPPVPPAAVGGSPALVHRLDRAQIGTAAVVARSHREIPIGFTLIQVDVGRLVDRLAALSEATGESYGLPEVIVQAVAGMHRDFPTFFGMLADDHTVALAAEPNVGVTVDVAGTLYVPVVRLAHERTLADIADILMDFRMKALTGGFSARELDGGNISISLNPDPGVVFVQPIVLWPQVCMVSVGAVGATGGQLVNIGLSYDHRVINGRAAVQFLTAIKAALERPDQLPTG